MESGAALGVGLVSAVAWGSILFASKRYFGQFRSTTFMTLMYGFASLWHLPISIGGALSSGSTVTTSHWTAGFVLASVCLVTLGLFAMFRAIAIGDISYVAPVNKISPVFAVPIEVVLLGQFLTPVQLVGVVIVTVAIYVANYEAGELWRPLWHAAVNRPGQLALFSAFVLAWFNVSQRYVLQELAVDPGVWIGIKLCLVALLLAPLGLRRVDWAAVRDDVPQFVVVGAVLALAEHLIGLTFAVLPASIALPVVSTQSVVAVLLGGVLLNEENFGLRLLAALTVIFGITVIALA